MGNKQSDDSNDKQKFLAFKEQFVDVGDRQDGRYGKYKLYESKVVTSSGNKEKVVAKTLEATSNEEFNKSTQLIKRREQLNSPHLCKVYGAYDSSEEMICGNFYRMTFMYEHVAYDLEMDLVNRSRLPNNHPDKVDLYEFSFLTRMSYGTSSKEY